MIHIIAIVTAKPGKREELLELVRNNVAAVRSESGCIEYSPLVDLDASASKFGEQTFVVVEKWQDEASLAGHRIAKHMVGYAAKSKELVEKRSIYLMQPVAALQDEA
jgi:quinol monooxygenase YgiN